MKLAKKIVKNEDGQVLVLFALLMVVLMGFAALVIDVGMVALQKSHLQNAADAAALAGAQDLPTAGTAKSTAVVFAGKNGLKATQNGVKKDGDTVTVTTPYSGDSTKIEVVCTRNVQYSFARVLGFTDTDVTARAVANKSGKSSKCVTVMLFSPKVRLHHCMWQSCQSKCIALFTQIILYT